MSKNTLHTLIIAASVTLIIAILCGLTFSAVIDFLFILILLLFC